MSGVVEAGSSLEQSAETCADENNFVAEGKAEKKNKGAPLSDRGRVRSLRGKRDSMIRCLGRRHVRDGTQEV